MKRILSVAFGAIVVAACVSVPAAPSASEETSPLVADGLPTVAIDAPGTGAVVPAAAAVAVLVRAADSVGVSRVDLMADGVTVDTFTTANPAGEPQVAAQLSWTPTAEGVHALSATAYRPDGTASVAATIAVTVVAPGATGTESLATTSPWPTPAESDAQPTAIPTVAPGQSTPPPTARPTRVPTPEPTVAVTASPTAAATELGLAALVFDTETAVIQAEVVNAPTGKFTEVTVSFRNVGTAASGPFVVSVRCRGHWNEATVDNVAAGEARKVTVSFSWLLLPQPQDESQAVLDTYHQVREASDRAPVVFFDHPDCRS